MADRTSSTGTDEERAVTRRVVLKQERVLVLPEGKTLEDIDPKVVETIRRALGIKGGKGNAQAHVEAWIVVGEFEGGSKQRAIEAYAGKSGEPDSKPGLYRAPSVTAWKGGRRYLPPVQRVEAEDID